MAKNRYINTKFWSDTFIVELNPLDRYLFMYLLTNEHTDICGIYELPLSRIAHETGIEKEMIEKMFKRLHGKIWYIEGWIFVKNFEKHQKVNDSIKKGIEKSRALVPAKILNIIKGIEDFTTDGIQTDPTLTTDSDLSKYKAEFKDEFKSKAKSKENHTQGNLAVAEIIKAFEEINPACKSMYGNITQRKACENLIKTYTEEKTQRVIKEILPKIIGRKYFPIIKTPHALFEKWSALEDAMLRYQQDNNKIKWL